MNRVLFIVKCRESYGHHHHHHSSGLKNSAQMCCDMLNAAGIESKLVEVIDNNDIDREVFQYQPTHVIIEAIWVVPEKFDVLHRLHPKVQWIIRLHSEIPFLAMEGNAIEWIQKYLKHHKVVIASNSREALHDLRVVLGNSPGDWCHEDCVAKVWYLPNYYVVTEEIPNSEPLSGWLNIASFGAIRPLKNQLIQAVAAIEFARQQGRGLRFHINESRIEQRGSSVLENLEALFDHPGRELVRWTWMEHKDFIRILSMMDASMCVSLSETFCIVAADTVAAGVPLVCSPEVPWSFPMSRSDPTSLNDIVNSLQMVTGIFKQEALKGNLHNLRDYVEKSKKVWLAYFAG